MAHPWSENSLVSIKSNWSRYSAFCLLKMKLADFVVWNDLSFPGLGTVAHDEESVSKKEGLGEPVACTVRGKNELLSEEVDWY
jgi:hypothetical protein